MSEVVYIFLCLKSFTFWKMCYMYAILQPELNCMIMIFGVFAWRIKSLIGCYRIAWALIVLLKYLFLWKLNFPLIFGGDISSRLLRHLAAPVVSWPFLCNNDDPSHPFVSTQLLSNNPRENFWWFLLSISMDNRTIAYFSFHLGIAHITHSSLDTDLLWQRMGRCTQR